MQAIYKVEGMTCQGCADNIQNGLNNQSFVSKANVSLEESMTDAIVEPLANAIWYFILEKFWASKIKS